MEVYGVQLRHQQPKISLIANNHLSIRGNSIEIYPEPFYDKLINWLSIYKNYSITVDIQLDIINCSSLRMLFYAMLIADANTYVKEKQINWYYSDEDQEETGIILSLMLKNSGFNLIKR